MNFYIAINENGGGNVSGSTKLVDVSVTHYQPKDEPIQMVKVNVTNGDFERVANYLYKFLERELNTDKNSEHYVRACDALKDILSYLNDLADIHLNEQ